MTHHALQLLSQHCIRNARGAKSKIEIFVARTAASLARVWCLALYLLWPRSARSRHFGREVHDLAILAAKCMILHFGRDGHDLDDLAAKGTIWAFWPRTARSGHFGRDGYDLPFWPESA